MANRPMRSPGHRSHVGDRGTVHLSVDDVLALLASSASGHAEIGKRVLSIEPENAACADNTRRVWTANTHRNVITFGVARMPVEATKRALEDEGMKFKPLVKKKRKCGHAHPHQRVVHYTREIAEALIYLHTLSAHGIYRHSRG
jgi:hypothetical protein